MTNHRDVKANILLVDDTPDNLRLLSTMLIDRGYGVRSVINGKMALMGAKAEPPDLILLDINMPGMNGYEVCERLKADESTRDIPVIFISALEDVLDKVKAFSTGGVDYITKPFQVQEVLARIHTHLTLRFVQKQLESQNQRLQEEIARKEQAEERFVKAFRLSPNPIAIASLEDNKLLEVNTSFLNLSEYSLDEVIGKSIDEVWIGREAEGLKESLDSLETSGPIYNQEFTLKTKSGNSKIVLLSLEKIEIAHHACVLLIANDITERKRLEREFISLVSHELRTPLTSLMGALDLLSSGQLGELTPQGQKVLSIAVNNTERLIRLVNDILDLERMKLGKINLQKDWCDCAEILLNAVATLQTMADEAQIQLEVYLQSVRLLPDDESEGQLFPPVRFVRLWADSDRILQTLINLINNAIKFSHPGGRVWLNIFRLENEVVFTVRDEGRGIPDDKLKIIFEPFQQVDISDSRVKGGSGLGLSICRQIVEQHGGRIWVESKLNQGSRFHFSLPLNEDKND